MGKKELQELLDMLDNYLWEVDGDDAKEVNAVMLQIESKLERM